MPDVAQSMIVALSMITKLPAPMTRCAAARAGGTWRLAIVLGVCGLLVSALAMPVRAAGAVVSLDYCADQFVLALLPRARILAVSVDATEHFSYMREAARGVRKVRSVAEDVLILAPDLVVRAYGGGANAPHFFRRAGIAVFQLGFVQSIDDVRENTRRVATALGEAARGEALIADMDRRLAAVRRHAPGTRALYITPGGFTAGPDTLVHEMLAAAGLANFQQQSGFRELPLERLAYERPDLIVTAFFGTRASSADAWSAAHHPIVRRQMAAAPLLHLDGAWTSCGGWFLVEAVEALAAPVAEAVAR